MTFLATTKQNGGLDFGSEYNLGRFRQWVKDNPGKNIKIEEVETKRTLSQNNFYWLYLTAIEKETGNNANDLHEYFKRTLLPPKFIKVFGKEIKIPASTTDLKKLDFSEYMEKINAETGVEIPDAEEYKKWRDSAPEIEK